MHLSPVQHIVAIGGAGFSGPTDQSLFEKFLLGLTGKPRPNICFVPTASGDAATYIQLFYDTYSLQNCQPTHLPLFTWGQDKPAEVLANQDIIFVGGGNTANMLAIWRLHGIDRLIIEAGQRGAVLCGVSAGSLCWFEGGITDSFGPQLAPLHDGLGLLAGTNCPHYDGEALRRPVYQRCVAEGLPAGLAADDGCALHFLDGHFQEAVSSRPGAAAYAVQLRVGHVSETQLAARYLGT